MRARFTLTVVSTQDGFIARSHDDAPASWASPEEQVLFFRDVEASDWAVMGRHTHEAADRPDRRRIVFSTGNGGWRRPTQLWLDPATLTPADLAPQVAHVHPLAEGLILGGTRVHDWFLDHGAIDRVHLTVEPVEFDAGLPIFTGRSGAPEDVFESLGFVRETETVLNARHTRHSVWSRAA